MVSGLGVKCFAAGFKLLAIFTVCSVLHLTARGAHRTIYRTRRASTTLPHAARIEQLTARGAYRTTYRTRRASNTLPHAARIEQLTARVNANNFFPKH